MIAVLRLLESLFQVLALLTINFAFVISIYEKVFLFFVTTARGCSIIVNRAENFIEVVRTLTAVKFKNIRNNDL